MQQESRMGRTLGQFEQLQDPLLRVVERYVRIPAGESLWVRPDTHYRMIFFLEGELAVSSTSGEQFILQKGDALIVPSTLGLTYRGRNPDRETISHILRIDLRDDKHSGCSGDASPHPDAFLNAVETHMREICHFPGVLSHFGSFDLVKLIKNELDRGTEASPWRMSGLCMALIVPLFEAREADAGSPNRPEVLRGEAAVEHASQYIREFPHHVLNLGKIAWQVQLSGEHLGRLFRKYRGSTVMHYVKQVRLEYATRYLESTDLPVVSICKKTGYSTPSLFCRHFKAKTGMTPLEFRMRVRNREKFSPSELSPLPGKQAAGASADDQ